MTGKKQDLAAVMPCQKFQGMGKPSVIVEGKAVVEKQRKRFSAALDEPHRRQADRQVDLIHGTGAYAL